jgi:hypothetical protein
VNWVRAAARRWKPIDCVEALKRTDTRWANGFLHAARCNVDATLSSGGNVTVLAERSMTSSIPIIFASGGDAGRGRFVAER